MKWSIYNQSLVRLGEILIGFDVINNWDAELKEMNKDKVGEPFHYPNTFLLLLGYAKVYFYLHYRQTEGVLPKDTLNLKFHQSLIILQLAEEYLYRLGIFNEFLNKEYDCITIENLSEKIKDGTIDIYNILSRYGADQKNCKSII